VLQENEAAQISGDEVLNLIFHPGLSTAEEITQISGRGVGMDVVRTVVERLKGQVTVESVPGHGTTFRLMMPLTLASIQALMFRVGKQHFAVPLDSVLEIMRADDSEIHKSGAIRSDGQYSFDGSQDASLCRDRCQWQPEIRLDR
jgi:two-component system chemotaxis sensor kinase CheA